MPITFNSTVRRSCPSTSRLMRARLDTEEKRRVMDSIVESIVVDKDAQEIGITLSSIRLSDRSASSGEVFSLPTSYFLLPPTRPLRE